MFKENEIKKVFHKKTILVTGGIGSIGLEIVRQLLRYGPKEIRVLDNRETELFYSHMDLKKGKDIVVPVFGNVQNRELVRKATKGVDIVFHAAAMKHVIMCENAPFEAVLTNVIGTENVIQASIQNKVKHMILISTDKAVNPTNVMGATKLLAERLISAQAILNKQDRIKFSVVRFGNVLTSRGSVLEIWKKQLANSEKIVVTDTEMTRFFMSIPDSVKLIFMATIMGVNGEIFIFKMPSVKIIDLATTYLEMMGQPKKFYNVIGKKPGEKMHEDLINKEEEIFLLENDIMFIRLPIFYYEKDAARFYKLGFKRSSSESFTSNYKGNMLKKSEIKMVLSETMEK